MNKVILLGRLTKDAEIRFTQSTNTKVAKFSLAVDRKYVKAGEERQTDFINIVSYDKMADFAEKYLKKGIKICVAGRIQNRVYDDNNGQKHYITEIISEEIDFAESPKKADESVLYSQTPVNSENTAQTQNTVETSTQPTDEILDGDDLPF